MSVSFEIPTSLPSTANLREHWRARAARAKTHRLQARLLTQQNYAPLAVSLSFPSSQITVTLTRVSPRQLDSDNLASACKGTRDGIADALGLDDGDSRLTWQYQQQKGKPPRVRVEIEVRANDQP